MKKLVLFLLLLAHAALATVRCPVCGMEFEKGAKTSFETLKDKEPAHLCSFSCAHKVHRRQPEAQLFAHDFATGENIPADKAFYLTKSKNLLKELPFDMPPSVVAFKTQDSAKKKLQQLTTSKEPDGVILQGFESLEKLYE